jgi:endonuclease V-like protein UPF0215 family
MGADRGKKECIQQANWKTSNMTSRFTHVIGFDDAPFDRDDRGDVLVVGAVYAGLRLDGVLSAKVRRDGVNATAVLIHTLRASRFVAQTHLVLLQGIAFAGFNVVDLEALHQALHLPVMAVVRRRPNLPRIKSALLEHVPGGLRKWRLIEKAGPVESVAGLFVQRAGIGIDDAGRELKRLAVHSSMPEPLRTAHLIAGGVTRGESRHRV